MIEVIARRRSRVIGMRMVIAYDAKPAAPSIVSSALVLLGGDQIASLLRLLAFVFSSVGFAQNFGLTFTYPQQETAALVRVSLFAMLFDLFQVLWLNSDCHVVLSLFRNSVHLRLSPQSNATQHRSHREARY